MQITGTNSVMDLWADIQFIKNIANSKRDKKTCLDYVQGVQAVWWEKRRPTDRTMDKRKSRGE